MPLVHLVGPLALAWIATAASAATAATTATVVATTTAASTTTASSVVPSTDARLLWRSTEIGDGIVMNDIDELVPTETSVFVVQSRMGGLGIELLAIDRAGTSGTVVEIEGEAPGHVNVPGSVDVSRDGRTLAVSAAIRARTVLRRPVVPPFEMTRAIDPVFDDAGIATGDGQRLVDGAVITFMSQQLLEDLEKRVTRLVRHDLAAHTTTVLHEAHTESGTVAGLASPTLWAWDASSDGVVFLNDDYHRATIAAIEPDGVRRFRVELPVPILRHRDEVVANNRNKIEDMRERFPGNAFAAPVETFPALEDLSARADDGRLRVVSSAGVGRGKDTIAAVEWWVLDATTGTVLGRRALELPGGAWSFDAIVWFGDRIYFAGEDATRGAVPEVLCFERSD